MTVPWPRAHLLQGEAEGKDSRREILQAVEHSQRAASRLQQRDLGIGQREGLARSCQVLGLHSMGTRVAGADSTLQDVKGGGSAHLLCICISHAYTQQLA